MINFYDIVKNDTKIINPQYKIHGIQIPFRALICAPSGKGKTNQLMNLIALMDKTFHKIILCVKSAEEPLYQHMIDKLGKNVEVFENGVIPKLNNSQEEKNPEEKEKKKEKKIQSLIVFDDLMYDKSPEILQYYIRGRKFGYSCIYISQTYYGAPIDIRKNIDYIFLGGGLLSKDIKSIINMYPVQISTEEFLDIYNQATRENLDILLIDLIARNLRYNITQKIIDI